jgi:hypothetical protein
MATPELTAFCMVEVISIWATNPYTIKIAAQLIRKQQQGFAFSF